MHQQPKLEWESYGSSIGIEHGWTKKKAKELPPSSLGMVRKRWTSNPISYSRQLRSYQEHHQLNTSTIKTGVGVSREFHGIEHGWTKKEAKESVVLFCYLIHPYEC
ncbi:hypothetical protein TIFTF001_025133 [Ficus carica]|uniref:Uncharacterized protein n=1 Tax=Ficus carica TaxID=3494 RepID=A0AA88AQT0_FICCA|nr:hypothetical protein TIFTF001_025133 [Ficus carica]